MGTRTADYRDPAISSRGTETPTGSGQETPSPHSTVPTVSPVPSEPQASSPDVTLMPDGSASGVSAASPESTHSTEDSVLSGSFVGRLKLTIPVAGVRPEQLQDTFTDARSEGRAH